MASTAPIPACLDDVTALVASLVSIDSVNPSLVSGGAGEAQIAAFVAQWLKAAGVAAEMYEVRPGRTNVIARVPGSGGGKSLLLNGHLDTVGVAGMASPHVPTLKGDRLYGRGSFDMKSGVAAAMLTIAQAPKLGLRGDVIFTAVCDEEYASIGTESVLARVSADAAIVTEPTGLDVVVAHKGFAWFEVETVGVAAHGSRPDLGVDAIVLMAGVLDGIKRLSSSLAAGRNHPLLGPPSIHASLIQGGQELSSYPERCRLSIERRTIPGETSIQAEAEINALLAELSVRDPKFRASLVPNLVREPFELSLQEPVLSALCEAARLKLGKKPEIRGLTYWVDAALLSAAGIPTVIFGPGGGGAHATEEWCNLSEVLQCSEALLETARRFCA